MFKYLLLFTILAFLAPAKPAQAQSSGEKQFIQFVFTNLESREQAVSIDQFIRQQQGVFISRADLNSKKYLIIFESDSDIDLAKLTTWMDDLGFTFKCPREGTHGIDKIIDQKITCDQ